MTAIAKLTKKAAEQLINARLMANTKLTQKLQNSKVCPQILSKQTAKNAI